MRPRRCELCGKLAWSTRTDTRGDEQLVVCTSSRRCGRRYLRRSFTAARPEHPSIPLGAIISVLATGSILALMIVAGWQTFGRDDAQRAISPVEAAPPAGPQPFTAPGVGEPALPPKLELPPGWEDYASPTDEPTSPEDRERVGDESVSSSLPSPDQLPPLVYPQGTDGVVPAGQEELRLAITHGRPDGGARVLTVQANRAFRVRITSNTAQLLRLYGSDESPIRLAAGEPRSLSFTLTRAGVYTLVSESSGVMIAAISVLP